MEFEWEGLSVLPTIHPSFILRSAETLAAAPGRDCAFLLANTGVSDSG